MKSANIFIRTFTALAFFLGTLVPASVAVPTKAEAGLDACLELATSFGLDDIAKVTDFVANHGQCIGDLANPSFLGVVAAVLLIEQLTNAYNSGSSCEAALGGIAGKPIAAALASLASALNLPESVKAQLVSYASDQGASNFVAFMNATPPLNVISGNWSCACAVRYSGVAEKIEEILSNLASCTGGVIESGLDALGNFYEDAFGGEKTGTMYAEEHIPADCSPGWNKGIYSYTIKKYDSSCKCPAPSNMVWGVNNDVYACKCPAGQAYGHDGKCKPCKDAKSYVGTDGMCKTCGYAEKAGSDSSGGKCVPECAPGQMMNASGKNQCTACPANYYAYTYGPTTSSGYCKQCPAGMISKAGSASCVSKCADKPWADWDSKTYSCKGKCPEGQVWAPWKEFDKTCTPCKGGTLYDFGTNSCKCKDWEALDKTSLTCKPICPPGQKWTDMHTPAGSYNSLTCQACPQGSEYNYALNKCSACPQGMNWSKNSAGIGVCSCPEGYNRQGGICAPNSPGGDKVKLDDKPIDVAPGKVERNKNCPFGYQWSPAKEKCVPALRGQGPQHQQRKLPPVSDMGRPGTGMMPGPSVTDTPLPSVPDATPVPSPVPSPAPVTATPTPTGPMSVPSAAPNMRTAPQMAPQATTPMTSPSAAPNYKP